MLEPRSAQRRRRRAGARRSSRRRRRARPSSAPVALAVAALVEARRAASPSAAQARAKSKWVSLREPAPCRTTTAAERLGRRAGTARRRGRRATPSSAGGSTLTVRMAWHDRAARWPPRNSSRPSSRSGSRLNERGPSRGRRLRRARARARVRHAGLRRRRGRPARPRPRLRRGASRARTDDFEVLSPPRRSRAPRSTRVRRGGPRRATSPPAASCTGAARRLRPGDGSTCTATPSRASELRAALDAGVGHVVIDNLRRARAPRAARRAAAARAAGARCASRPASARDTHRQISTGQADSKFGFDLATRRAAIERAAGLATRSSSPACTCTSARSSSTLEPFRAARRGDRRRSATFRDLQPRRRPRRRLHARARAAVASRTTSTRRSTPCATSSAPDKRILDEPGRALVANARVTLYTRRDRQAQRRRPASRVDGGMSDNLRPMLYGARYEAHVADRVAAAATRCHARRQALRVRRRDRARRAPRRPAAGRRARDARPPAPTATRWPTTTTACRAPPVVFSPDGDARVVVRRETYEDLLRARCLSRVFRIGLLGHGTVGGAFAELLRERAAQIEPITGLRPEITGVLTPHARRLRRDPRRLRPDRRADRRHRARARLRAARDARRQARRHRQQAAALPARRGAVGERARARRAAALRGRGRRRRAGHPRARRVARRRRTSSASTASSTARRTSSSPRWRATGALLRGRAGRGAGARLRRGRPDRRRQRPRRRGEDGDPRAAGVRHAGAPRPGRATRASSTSPPTTWSTRASSAWG